MEIESLRKRVWFAAKCKVKGKSCENIMRNIEYPDKKYVQHLFNKYIWMMSNFPYVLD